MSAGVLKTAAMELLGSTGVAVHSASAQELGLCS